MRAEAIELLRTEKDATGEEIARWTILAADSDDQTRQQGPTTHRRQQWSRDAPRRRLTTDAAPGPADRWYSTTDAARLLAVSDWVRRRIESLELRARRIGGTRRSVTRIWGPDLVRFVLDAQERPPRKDRATSQPARP